MRGRGIMLARNCTWTCYKEYKLSILIHIRKHFHMFYINPVIANPTGSAGPGKSFSRASLFKLFISVDQFKAACFYRGYTVLLIYIQKMPDSYLISCQSFHRGRKYLFLFCIDLSTKLLSRYQFVLLLLPFLRKIQLRSGLFYYLADRVKTGR